MYVSKDSMWPVLYEIFWNQLALGHSSMHGFPTTCGSGEKELNPAVVLNPRAIAQISYLYTRTLSSC